MLPHHGPGRSPHNVLSVSQTYAVEVTYSADVNHLAHLLARRCFVPRLSAIYVLVESGSSDENMKLGVAGIYSLQVWKWSMMAG